MDNLQAKPTLWQTNPKLKGLLLILIFVFLACGLSLVVLNQIQAYSDYQNSLTDKAPLPQHQVKSATANSDSLLSATDYTITDSQTAGWKTYKNNQYGFEFNYPSILAEVVVNENVGGWFTFTLNTQAQETPEYGPISLNIQKGTLNPKHLSVFIQPDAELQDISTLNVNGQTWYSFLLAQWPTCSDAFFETQNQQNIFEMSFSRCSQGFDTYLKKHLEVIDEVIKSFKFIK